VADIAARLEETLAQDEARARAVPAEQWDGEDALQEWNDLGDEAFTHARHHDPEAVLARIAAERKIIDRYREAQGQMLFTVPGHNDAYLSALSFAVETLAEGHGIA
jgi:hypothetical protein